MNFEDFQNSWQNQNAGTNISINTDLLLQEIRRNQQQFRATIFWRDAREVGAAILLIPVFIWMGWRLHDWTDYLIAAACLFVSAFFVIDRWYQKKKLPALHDSLSGCIESSLAEVRHQIWLLKNVLWWYLLPIAATVLFSTFWSELRSVKTLAERAVDLSISTAVVLLINWGLYWLNQFAVRKSLEPRRRELESLRASLE